MYEMWRDISAVDCGIPLIDCSNFQKLEGVKIAWLPGMKAVGIADWYFLTWHTGDLRRYKEAGGDAKKIVCHFLTYDTGIIDPLWGTETFLKRTERMKAEGICHVVSPDFSSWTDMPVVAQLYNIYKSAVVTSDLARSGFNIIPNVTFGHRSLSNVHLSIFHNAKQILIDACHIKTSSICDANEKTFYDNLKIASQKYKGSSLLLWANSTFVASKAAAYFGNCELIMSRMLMLGKLVKMINKKKGEVIKHGKGR